ncbi:hypothetical protein PsorP6_012727 [Peronosclerospora sorghi]|uniref:Uncharacterized protein n=1 Tax=Peronosclerospora sorghi TaxID=230839 RepID=A0ACC0WJ66_9STRA|nr:hypothetical protein PsorP6_012727 [Peronosclerospora sorghi]
MEVADSSIRGTPGGDGKGLLPSINPKDSPVAADNSVFKNFEKLWTIAQKMSLNDLRGGDGFGEGGVPVAMQDVHKQNDHLT